MKKRCIWFTIFLVVVSFTVIVNTALCKIDQRSIVGLWLFDEPDGQIAKDFSGNGHDGQFKGAAVRVAGKYGKALELAGKDYVNVPNSAGLSIGKQFSMHLWFYAKDKSNWRQFIAKDNEYLFRIDPPSEGNKISAFIKAGGAWEPRVSASVPDLEKWTHVVATYDGDLVKIYVNGKASAQGSRPGNVSSTNNPLEFGRWGGALIGDDIGYFIGMLDEIALFSVALTDSDVLEAMDGLQRFRASVDVSEKLASTWGNIKKE